MKKPAESIRRGQQGVLILAFQSGGQIFILHQCLKHLKMKLRLSLESGMLGIGLTIANLNFLHRGSNFIYVDVLTPVLLV